MSDLPEHIQKILDESDDANLSPDVIRMRLVEIAATHLPDHIRLHDDALTAWVRNAYRIVMHK